MDPCASFHPSYKTGCNGSTSLVFAYALWLLPSLPTAPSLFLSPTQIHMSTVLPIFLQGDCSWVGLEAGRSAVLTHVLSSTPKHPQVRIPQVK